MWIMRNPCPLQMGGKTLVITVFPNTGGYGKSECQNRTQGKKFHILHFYTKGNQERNTPPLGGILPFKFQPRLKLVRMCESYSEAEKNILQQYADENLKAVLSVMNRLREA